MSDEHSGSTPTLSQFDPTLIPFQKNVIKDIRHKYDYSIGVHEVLLSGSVGSAKSLLLAHLLLTHCLFFKKARALMGRQTMPDLKDTLIQKVIEHFGEDLTEGEDYDYNRSAQKFTFSNGSELISRSWHDKDFFKFRSLELSAAGIEELTENGKEYKDFYTELSFRVGRLPHVKENWIVSATNPDAPSHWAYERFVLNPNPNRHVYYSVTSDNPFLPKSYINKLKEDLDPKMARRMIYGEWIEIAQEIIYHNYDKDRNFKNEEYEIELGLPLDIMFDFNIGLGKPMSACIGQYDLYGTFHAARTFIVEGARTQDILDEMQAAGVFELPVKFRVFGDATGRHSDTRSKLSDYDIIENFLANYKNGHGRDLNYEIHVPASNPPVRTRHNKVNGIMMNSNGRVRCYVYKDAAKLDEGLRLTKLKKGSGYVEDDSDDFQHVTTAFGYWVSYVLDDNLDKQITIRQR